eukprot:scaffold651_cov174-Ochromonas_danica.AAC.13
MTLLSLGSVDFQIEAGGINNDDDDETKSGDEDFFNKATIALFDFPDFYYISAFVLLLIVWSEMYLKSRRHWMSAKRFQCLWMWSYFIFNIIIYTAQITLYTLLFLPKVDHVVETNLIFLTLSAFNIGIPLIWLAFFFYMTILFAGFPYASPAATKRLNTLSGLVFMWTTTRLAWGVVALSSVLQHWVTEVRRSKTFYTIILILIFLVAEVFPIIFSLRHSTLQSLSDTNDSRDGRGSGSVNSEGSNSTHQGIRYSQIVPHGSSSSGSGGLSSHDVINPLLPPSAPIEEQKQQQQQTRESSWASDESALYHPTRTSFSERGQDRFSASYLSAHQGLSRSGQGRPQERGSDLSSSRQRSLADDSGEGGKTWQSFWSGMLGV